MLVLNLQRTYKPFGKITLDFDKPAKISKNINFI